MITDRKRRIATKHELGLSEREIANIARFRESAQYLESMVYVPVLSNGFDHDRILEFITITEIR